MCEEVEAYGKICEIEGISEYLLLKDGRTSKFTKKLPKYYLYLLAKVLGSFWRCTKIMRVENIESRNRILTETQWIVISNSNDLVIDEEGVWRFDDYFITFQGDIAITSDSWLLYYPDRTQIRKLGEARIYIDETQETSIFFRDSKNAREFIEEAIEDLSSNFLLVKIYPEINQKLLERFEIHFGENYRYQQCKEVVSFVFKYYPKEEINVTI